MNYSMRKLPRSSRYICKPKKEKLVDDFIIPVCRPSRDSILANHFGNKSLNETKKLWKIKGDAKMASTAQPSTNRHFFKVEYLKLKGHIISR